MPQFINSLSALVSGPQGRDEESSFIRAENCAAGTEKDGLKAAVWEEVGG